MDFFTVELLTLRGLVTYYILFVIQMETRSVIIPAAPYGKMDPTSCSESDGFRIWRNHYQKVLHRHFVGGRVAAAETPRPLAQSECLCGTMGSLSETGVPVEDDPI